MSKDGECLIARAQSDTLILCGMSGLSRKKGAPEHAAERILKCRMPGFDRGHSYVQDGADPPHITHEEAGLAGATELRDGMGVSLHQPLRMLPSQQRHHLLR